MTYEKILKEDSPRFTDKELLVLVLSIGLCLTLFGNALFYKMRPPIWTVEVYEIFEVVHAKRGTQDWTFVYTYGQGQYFFRGDWDIKPNCSYVFTYHETGKRWRDLVMVEPPREFVPLVREAEDCGCPEDSN